MPERRLERNPSPQAGWACLSNSLSVDHRVLLSQLADPTTRGALARWLLAACAIGFLMTVLVMAGLGYGASRMSFALVFWLVLVFIPLRIAVEASGPLGARLRHALAQRAVADPRRYERADMVPFVVRDLFAREVTMPRIAKPVHALKAREAAIAILSRTAPRADAGDLLRAIRTTLAATAAEAVQVSAAATGIAADAIQARWDSARALGAMGALTTVLAAAYADRWGTAPVIPELEGRPLNDFLDAALDYCDEAALQVDALPWTEPPLATTAATGDIDDVRATWQTFLAAGTPSPRALDAFLATVLPASTRAPGPG